MVGLGIGLPEAALVGGVGAGREVVEVDALERIELLAAVEIRSCDADFRILNRQAVGIIRDKVAGADRFGSMEMEVHGRRDFQVLAAKLDI